MQTSSKPLISPVACVLQSAQSYQLRCASYCMHSGLWQAVGSRQRL